MFQDQIQSEKMSSNSSSERVQFDVYKDIFETTTTSEEEESIEVNSCLPDCQLRAHSAKFKMIQVHNLSSGAGCWQPESGKKLQINPKPSSFRDLLVIDPHRTVGSCPCFWHY
jgi:hypothetical protein